MLHMKDLGSGEEGAETTSHLVWGTPVRALVWGESGSPVRFSPVIAVGK